MFGEYGAFIIPSYVVTFGSIAILAVMIVLAHRSAKGELERLEAQGIRRRADAGKRRDNASGESENRS